MKSMTQRGSGPGAPRPQGRERTIGQAPTRAALVAWRASLLMPLAAGLAACIDPLVSDEVVRADLILSAGAEVPVLVDDLAERARVDQNDGLDGDYVPLRSAFAHGDLVRFWDMGPASPYPIPLYLLVTEDVAGTFEVGAKRYAALPDHPPIFDAIPGDPGYSPWWTVVLVPVTAAYAGEVLPSFASVDEAFRRGLVEAPLPLTATINCPVVLPEARLEVSPGDHDGALAPSVAYYRMKTVHYFTFDTVPVDPKVGEVAAPPVYFLRREGGEPLSESLRGVDMTADGDLLDANDLFAAVPGDADYTGMVSLVRAVISPRIDAIDTYRAEDRTDLSAAETLFTSPGVADPDVLVALEAVGTTLNRPIQSTPEAR